MGRSVSGLVDDLQDQPIIEPSHAMVRTVRCPWDGSKCPCNFDIDVLNTKVSHDNFSLFLCKAILKAGAAYYSTTNTR